MLASLEWIRMLCPVDREAGEVADALTARGLTVDAIERSGDDHALDIDVPANRPDCLGHLGLAREVSAAFGVPLRESDGAEPAPGASSAGAVRVEIEAPDLCGRYSAGVVRGVRVGSSPAWVVRRLETCGLRSVNNVVDASNLVLLELGNPIHFFDLARVGEATIRVRRARAGERLRTLDGEMRTLDDSMLVIADASRASALAGVIGGADSEIGDRTVDVLVEAAWFAPGSIRRTARRLGVQTDASYRFSRGVDPAGIFPAQRLAARLLSELARGEADPSIVDVFPGAAERPRLALRTEQVSRLLGYRPSDDEMIGALAALRLDPERDGNDRILVHVPTWRVDLEREADLVEEVARHLGYDRVPAVSLGMPALATAAGPPAVEDSVRDVLAHLGFQEALGYSMVADAEDRPFVEPDAPDAIALTNPIAESLARLRRSVLPGLARAADLNHRRGSRDVRLFEVARVFRDSGLGAFPDEPRRAGLAWSGSARTHHWSEPERDVDLYDVMGVVERVLESSGGPHTMTREPGDVPGLHPGRSVVWRRGDGTVAARGGAVHPSIQSGLLHPLFLAEIDIGAAARTADVPQYRPLPRVNPVHRDLSLLLEAAVPFAEVRGVLESVEAPAPVAFEVLDRYTGKPLAEGQTSLTIRIMLHPPRKALTEQEIEGYRLALVEALRTRLGIEIRG